MICNIIVLTNKVVGGYSIIFVGQNTQAIQDRLSEHKISRTNPTQIHAASPNDGPAGKLFVEEIVKAACLQINLSSFLHKLQYATVGLYLTKPTRRGLKK